MRLLVVEDEKNVGALLKKSLETECYVVDLAIDGARGFNMALLYNYDLIVLDNMLPNKNGIEICKDLRARGFTVPIIILSVKTETFTKVQLLNAGADDYLSKPFSFEELLARIQALLRRPKQISGDILSAGGLSLDTQKHTVSFQNHDIYLSRKEFMLLEYFMRNMGVVLSRGMLLEHVWDIHTDPFSNTIESHVMSLRKKIEHVYNKKFIHTIPGRGYKFLVENT